MEKQESPVDALGSGITPSVRLGRATRRWELQ